MCPGNLFCLCVYSMQLLSSLIKELKCWVSVSPSLSGIFFCFFFLLLLLLWHKATGAYFVTVTGIKQDTALRQRQTGAGMSYFSIMPAALFLLLAYLSRPASISRSVTLWSESGWWEERENMTAPHVVLPPRGWFVY